MNKTVDIEAFDYIYFIGVGGIGMSALARWFKAQGHHVAGYDRVSTVLTKKLEEEGILVNYEDDEASIPASFQKNVLVVYTPAIPEKSVQLNFFVGRGIPLYKRSEVLGLITKDYLTVAVAGTHGKTTTSTMIAHLLHSAGESCTAFLGGISTNLNSNLLIGSEIDEQILVVEADEYDRSFLKLHPDIAIITSVEADHLDVYGEADELTKSFKAFANKVPEDGSLVVQKDYSPIFNTDFNYGIDDADYFAENQKVENGIVYFDAITPEGKIQNIPLHQPGYHNIENALASIAVAQQLEINKKDIINAFSTYKGVRRRFEYVYQSDNKIYIDDYAHHPTEIKAFISSVRELYPRRKITAIFQPHLYSRTRDFAEEFASSLSLADEVILTDIYPARELPIDGVSSDIVLNDITTQKELCSKDEVMDLLQNKKLDVLLTIGAGDIDQLVEPIKLMLNNSHN